MAESWFSGLDEDTLCAVAAGSDAFIGAFLCCATCCFAESGRHTLRFRLIRAGEMCWIVVPAGSDAPTAVLLSCAVGRFVESGPDAHVQAVHPEIERPAPSPSCTA